MAAMKDLIESLNALAIWKRLTPLPDEVSELRRRVEQLEARLGAASAGGLEQCPLCNSMQFKRTASRADPTFGELGVMRDSWTCQSCGHLEQRQRDTHQQAR